MVASSDGFLASMRFAQLEAFLALPPQRVDPLEWWRVNERKFRFVAPLAKKFLGYAGDLAQQEMTSQTIGRTWPIAFGRLALLYYDLNDYKDAIKCGATHVRIGTSIFGERT